MATLVERNDRVRVAGMGNAFGTVTEVRGDKVKVKMDGAGFVITATKRQVFIASRGGAR